MDKLDLLVKRYILLYLNAQDKIKTLALVSKKWNKLIYSGYAWQSLFSPQYDKSWNIFRVNERLFTKFSHFKGVKDLHLYKYNLQHLQAHVNQIQNIYIENEYGVDQSGDIDQINKLIRNDAVFIKIKNKDKIYNFMEDIHILSSSGVYQNGTIVKKSIKNVEQFNIRDHYNRTPLHYAAGWNTDIKVINFLIRKGNKLQSVDWDCQTPYHYALMYNSNVIVIQYLLEEGRKIFQSKSIRDSLGQNILHFAAYNSNVEVIQFILQKGTDIKARDFIEQTPLHIAASSNRNQKVLQFLVEKGSQLQARDKQGRTPLIIAAILNQNVEVLKMLVELGSDICACDNKNRTSLDYAARWSDDIERVKFLVDRGADVESLDLVGESPLDWIRHNSRGEQLLNHLLSKENKDK